VRELSVEQFAARLAARSAAPSGGTAAAYQLAYGAGLVAMLARFSDDPIALGIAVEADGIPLAALPAPANHRDDGLLAATLDALVGVGPLPAQPVVHLDAGYDYQPCRQVLAERGMAGEIATRGRPAPIQVGRRWVIERTHAWADQYGKLRWCTERRRRVVEFWLALASAVIVCGRLIRRAWTLLSLGRPPTPPPITAYGRRPYRPPQARERHHLFTDRRGRPTIDYGLAIVNSFRMTAGERGTRDEAVIVGRTLYIHTPDGFGTSELAKELLVKRRRDPLAMGTARNWSTISKLLALCES